MSQVPDHRGKSVETRKLPRELCRMLPPTEFARRMRRRYWITIAIWTPLIVIMIGASQFLGGVLLMAQGRVVPVVADLFSEGVAKLVSVGFWFLAVVVISLLVPGAIAWATGWHILSPRYRAMIAANGHCAACGYAIMDLQPEPDGCTVCPECGSAWWCHEKESLQDA